MGTVEGHDSLCIDIFTVFSRRHSKHSDSLLPPTHHSNASSLSPLGIHHSGSGEYYFSASFLALGQRHLATCPRRRRRFAAAPPMGAHHFDHFSYCFLRIERLSQRSFEDNRVSIFERNLFKGLVHARGPALLVRHVFV